MEIVGIILIVLQVLSLFGGLPSPAGGGGYVLSYYLGYFAPGIIGVILLIKARKKQAKKDAEQQEEESKQ